MKVKTQRLTAQAWISGGRDAEDYWAEGRLAHVEVELTDANEVRLGIHLSVGMSEDAGIYLTRSDAARLSVLLAAASIQELA